MADLNEFNSVSEDVVSGVDTVKKGKGGLIAGITAGVIVAAAGGCAIAYNVSDFVKNQVKLAVSSPESYYTWVTEKNSSSFAKQVSVQYKEYLDSASKGQNVSMSLKYEASDEAKSMLKDEIFGSDTDTLDNDTKTLINIIDNTSDLGVGIDVSALESQMMGKVYASQNGQRLFNVEMAADYSNLDVFFRIAELTEQWLIINVPEDEDGDGGIYGTNDIIEKYKSSLKDPGEIITPEELEKEIDRYIGVWNSSVKDIELEKKEEIVIDDITVKYTAASVTLDEEQVTAVVKNFAQSAKEDALLREIVCTRLEAVSESDFDSALDEILNDTSKVDSDDTVTLTTYIDPRGDIRGISLIDPDGTEKMRAVLGRDGGQIRGELIVDDECSIKLTAEENNKKYSGILDITEVNYDDNETVSVEFTDLEVVNEKKGYMSGNISFIVPETDVISIALNGSDTAQEISSDIIVDKKNFGRAVLTYSVNEGAEIELPSKNDAFAVDSLGYNFDIEEYVDADSMESFISGILDKLGFGEYGKELSHMAVSNMYGLYDFGGWDDDSDFSIDDYDWDIDDEDDLDFDFESLENKAYINVYDEDFEATFTGFDGPLSEGAVMADIKGDGVYTVSVSADNDYYRKQYHSLPKGIAMLNLVIDGIETTGQEVIEIKSIKVDGKDVLIPGVESAPYVGSDLISMPIYAGKDYMAMYDNMIPDDAVKEWTTIEITFELKNN